VSAAFISERHGERGSAAVEFALVIPLILTMSLALVQVGLLVKDRVLVEESARTGARAAAVSADDDEVRQAVLSAAVGMDQAHLEVTVRREGGAGSPVTVTVLYRAPATLPLVGWLFPDMVDLRGAAVMRQEVG
jgi:Flp pilus assembly protein TadG